MEHRITAPAPGVVNHVRVRPGEQVANGALLIVLEEVPEEVTEESEAGGSA